MENLNVNDTVNTINDLRKSNKDCWYSHSLKLGEYELTVKGFNTWIQVLKLSKVNEDGTYTPLFNVGSCMDINVTQYKGWLTDNLTYIKHTFSV